jgi:hypothetical protein
VEKLNPKARAIHARMLTSKNREEIKIDENHEIACGKSDH